MQKLSHEPFIKDQVAIQQVKTSFQKRLCQQLQLTEVQAPIITVKGSGVQDDLNGIEKPVKVSSELIEQELEVVQSLAKWKRQLLARADFVVGTGLVTQMRAIRQDEEQLSERHSLYVDQWDWEQVIKESERDLDYLMQTVKKIYQAIYQTEQQVSDKPFLPKEITFIHSEDLLKQYPKLSSKQREYQACKEFGAVFLIGIGGPLSDGEIHDGRAPDYDDWTTVTAGDKKGLNGDILVWNPVLEDAFEISSMGIRVSPEVLTQQLKYRGLQQRAELLWHQQLLAGKMPATIGGGIGQSRLAMLLLQKPHIGQVQFSVWPAEQEHLLL